MVSKYQHIKTSLGEGVLYEDPDFPANNDSIGTKGILPRPAAWKRPKEISTNAKFIIDGAGRFDLIQGELGNCWFVAAAAILATRRELFTKVVPEDQSLQNNYAGIFHFYFWKFGEWLEIVIDDRLPVDGAGNLLFCSNRDTPDEYWGALLEKAFAKFYGSYEDIDSGLVRDALVDFTGGVSEYIAINQRTRDKLPTNLFDLMKETFKRSSLMGSGIWNTESLPSESQQTTQDSLQFQANHEDLFDPGTIRAGEVLLRNGLYAGHAYSITNLATVTDKTGKSHNLIRLRNPWGLGEWKGDWSDRSEKWKTIREDDKRKLNLTVENEGEFWISYEDFIEQFNVLDIVHLNPSNYTGNLEETFQSKYVVWHESSFRGAWRRGINAGGSGLLSPHKDLYWTNPQYHLTLTDPDPTDEDNQAVVVISLMKGVRRGDKVAIGLSVHLVRDGTPKPLDGQNYDQRALQMKVKNTRTLAREVSCQIKLDPGVYCIIPNTLKANQEAEYLLRIYTIKEITASLIDEPTGPIDVPRRDPSRPTETNVLSKEFYEKYGGDDGADAKEIQDMFNNAYKEVFRRDGPFSLETCRALVSLEDKFSTGYVVYYHAKKLWQFVTEWKVKFDDYDRDMSGSMETYELRNLFKDIGFSLGYGSLISIAVRYGGRNEKIMFDDFILLAAKTRKSYEAFKKYSGGEQSRKGENQNASLNLEQWMMTTLSL